MYRYEVTLSVKNSIEGEIGKPLFYTEDSKYYINDDNRHVPIYYNESDGQGDFNPTQKTLDEICQKLFTTDFSAQSTQTEHSNIEIVSLGTLTPGGLNRVAFTKPDGESKTYISHNFCDENSWEISTSDSTWELKPPVDETWKVLRGEVQFSHDVQLGTRTPTPGILNLDFMYLGTKIDSESRQFKSITDVYDLGNKHYTMNATVDGIPGITTVVFDYADAITLVGAANMCMTFYIEDHIKLGGTFCSISFVVEKM